MATKKKTATVAKTETATAGPVTVTRDPAIEGQYLLTTDGVPNEVARGFLTSWGGRWNPSEKRWTINAVAFAEDRDSLLSEVNEQSVAETFAAIVKIAHNGKPMKGSKAAIAEREAKKKARDEAKALVESRLRAEATAAGSGDLDAPPPSAEAQQAVQTSVLAASTGIDPEVLAQVIAQSVTAALTAALKGGK